ncbi:chaperone protein DNAJ [Trypanosoma vivax]|nr:chaperone protein DNAJ [Trypanosoma vivax]
MRGATHCTRGVLVSRGPMGLQEEQAEEVRRLLHCGATRADAFAVLQLDPQSCETADVNRNFRRIVLKVHPDKCTLEKAADAFHVAENAHKLLSNEAALVRLKLAYQKKKEREAALAEEEARRKTLVGSSTGPTAVDEASLSREERMRRRRHEHMVEQQLEAARLAEEAAQKKKRVERETRERAELSAELERQRKEWKDLNLF